MESKSLNVIEAYLQWRAAMERQYGRMIYAPTKPKEITQ